MSTSSWSAAIQSTSVDVDHPNIGIIATVAFTDGETSITQSFRGLHSLDEVQTAVLNRVALLNAAAALAGAVAIGPVTIAPPLTSQQVTALSPFLTLAQSDETNVDALNAPTIANPVAQANVLAPLDTNGVLGLLSPSSLGNLWKNPNATTVRDDVRRQDRQALAQWAVLAAASGDITGEERTAVVTACQATVLDPQWPAHVSRASLVLGRDLTLTDVAYARRVLSA